MKILVINPPNKPFTNKSILAEPLDVLSIATIVKQKYSNTEVIDMDVKRMENNINEYLSDDNLVIFVYDYQIPLHTSEAKYNIFEIIKNANKPCKFIMIGKTSTFHYQEFIDKGIDIIIKGIAENVINDCIENINNLDNLKAIPNLIINDINKVIKTKEKKVINSYKSFPIPDRSLININDYMDTRTIITSRGCINKCNFCTTPFFFGPWSRKDYIEVVDEIEYLVNNFNTKKILFLDDNFPVDKIRVINICQEIKKRKIKCLFGCLCSINCFDEELMKVMYDTGFRWLHFGIESGSAKILKIMNKQMDIKKIIEVIKKVKQIGYRVRTSIILDYPTTTCDDLNKTEKLLAKLEPHEIRLHYLAYRLGTPIYKEEVANKTQYIHSNKPNNANIELNSSIEKIKNMLKERNYTLIENDVDWTKYNALEKNFKVATFTPIKYGMCWYE